MITSLSVIPLVFSFATVPIPSVNAATISQDTSSPTWLEFAAWEINSNTPNGLQLTLILLIPVWAGATYIVLLCFIGVVAGCWKVCCARAPATAVAQAQAMQIAVANVSLQMPTIVMGNVPQGILNVPNPDQPAIISESGRPSLDITVISDSDSVRSTVAS